MFPPVRYGCDYCVGSSAPCPISAHAPFDVKLFKKYDSFKISYDQVQFQSEFNVNPSEILFSSKIEDLDIDVVNWDGLPVFFQNENKDSFHS